MKKIFVVLASFVLFIYFLAYAGFFRNNRDPFAVANYYYSCMKEGEWPLSYQVCNREYFNYAIILNNYEKFKLNRITKMEIVPLFVSDQHASVSAQLTYKNGSSIASGMELEKNGRNWLVRKVEYKF